MKQTAQQYLQDDQYQPLRKVVASLESEASIPSHYNLRPNLNANDLLDAKALYQIEMGLIPDYREECIRLYETFFIESRLNNALQFVPVMQTLKPIDENAFKKFSENPETNHVLVKNEWIKIVLIHWTPGKYSDIHGHPDGGGIYKVLKGELEEQRYTVNQQLISTCQYRKGAIGYIDDELAYHAVGNISNESAFSLHAYLRN